MAKVRAFVAIELDPALREALGAVEDDLKRQTDLPVRWVRPEAIHLTLKFLGGVDVDLLDEIEGRLKAAADRTKPFQIRLGGLGGFPSLQRPSVLWIGVTGDVDPILALQEEIEAELESLDVPRESRQFHPHLTLGRVRAGRRAGGRPDTAALAQAVGAPTAEQLVEGISLMKSSLTPEGARYTRLAFVNLGTGLSASEP